jgi:hypothetical protein
MTKVPYRLTLVFTPSHVFRQEVFSSIPEQGASALRLVVTTRDHGFPMRTLISANHRYWRAVLLGVLLLLGAGWHACVTVPRDREREEVLVSFFFTGRHDSVCLSGDFNGWSSESHCLQRKGEEWSIQLALPPGRYRYGFVIDKREWAWDPGAPVQEDDGFGKKNSLLVIDSAVTKRLSPP